MTTTRIKRCTHCNIIYHYHPSYYGFMPRFNDDQYCPKCAETISKALEDIPVKFEKRFIPTTDYTREQIIEAQEKRINKSSLPVRRIHPCLFDLKNPENKNHIISEPMRDRTSEKTVYYKASWWSEESNNVKIEKEVWWDIEKNIIAKNQNNYNKR